MNAPTPRPTVLTVLCILTFLSSISGLWTQSERLWNPGVVADKTRELFQSAREKLEEQPSQADTKTVDRLLESVIQRTTPDMIRKSAVIMLIFESLTLYAAYLMWNLKKLGFYLYLGGMVVAFLGSVLVIGGWLGVVTGLAGIFFSSIMCIIYAFNLKYLE
ncbi:hypothetical protein L0657_02005 [Dyadobacter sp. CY345]|uniref:hypothetical protein n=1 Tax=Dyadobacter sp. CY345 TaxID=2909335 RepID=UPI001F435B97|nr:hypothetical protein [Dyadobacter sp. CY345]MCF2442714.1 hypothetical protein [Dyadobacter sp. CY345]